MDPARTQASPGVFGAFLQCDNCDKNRHRHLLPVLGVLLCFIDPRVGKIRMVLIIPAKKLGDTEIAERDRSVLVMRARYRSAGLTPHQRRWTDAG